MGGPVTEVATCVLAGNPGPMTLDGTNTWVLRVPGASQAIVVDPGPDNPEHLDAIDAALRGARPALVVLTHRHSDHAAAAATYAARHRAPVRAWDPSAVLGAEGFGGSDVLAVGELELRVVATPGHSADSVTFALPDALLTGDTVLGRGSTVVVPPDGRLRAYLESLETLAALAEGRSYVLPGHGPALPDPSAVIAGYLAHRRERIAQVRAAVDEGITDVEAIVDFAYPALAQPLRAPAGWSVQAALDYLDDTDD